MTSNPSSPAEPLRHAVSLTVTMFGTHDAIEKAISDELGRRGCRTHSVSVETGWLQSTRHAIVRLDTIAGDSAIRGLTAAEGPGVHVVAICLEPADARDSARLRQLCEECSSTHNVSLIWHDAVGSPEPLIAEDEDPPARRLAVAVVDEVAGQVDPVVRPSFSARSLVG